MSSQREGAINPEQKTDDERKISELRNAVAENGTRNKFTSFGDMVYLWIYRFNLNTALYLLEPWERFLITFIIIALLAYIVCGLYYSALHPLLERIKSSHI